MKWKYKREIIRETTRKFEAKTERGKINGAEGIIKKRLKRTKGQNEIDEKKRGKKQRMRKEYMNKDLLTLTSNYELSRGWQFFIMTPITSYLVFVVLQLRLQPRVIVLFLTQITGTCLIRQKQKIVLTTKKTFL